MVVQSTALVLQLAATDPTLVDDPLSNLKVGGNLREGAGSLASNESIHKYNFINIIISKIEDPNLVAQIINSTVSF